MTFKTSNVTVRMGIRDAAYRLGKLSELLTLGHGPVDSPLGDQIDVLANQMEAALAAAGYTGAEPPDAVRVTNGDVLTVASGSTKTAPAKATVADNELTSLALTAATDALTSNGDAISIQDRNGTTLKGDAVVARVVDSRLISAAFSSLTNGISSDGNPLNVTTARGGSTVTGRVRLYVSNNILTSAYLDATAALQTGVTVPVQNSIGQNIQPGTVTVTNNLVASVKLPANYTAFGDGIAHKVTDGAGKTAQATAKVSGGVLTDQTLPGTVALVADAQVLPVTGGTVTLAIANGAITATYAPTA